MSAYILRFEKSGTIRFISHLDLMRQFHRAFKRAGIALAYSQGFNPHPKVCFGQPLSLGHVSVGEYIEFETLGDHNTKDMIAALNETLPQGLKVTAVRPFTAGKRTIAALVQYASYEILWNGIRDQMDPANAAKDFLGQDSILIEKRKKKGNFAEIDIRPFVKALDIEKNNDGLVVHTTLAAGSNANLNPEYLIKALFAFMALPYEKETFVIKRLDLFDEEGRSLGETGTEENIF